MRLPHPVDETSVDTPAGTSQRTALEPSERSGEYRIVAVRRASKKIAVRRAASRSGATPSTTETETALRPASQSSVIAKEARRASQASRIANEALRPASPSSPSSIVATTAARPASTSAMTAARSVPPRPAADETGPRAGTIAETLPERPASNELSRTRANDPSPSAPLRTATHSMPAATLEIEPTAHPSSRGAIADLEAVDVDIVLDFDDASADRRPLDTIAGDLPKVVRFTPQPMAAVEVSPPNAAAALAYTAPAQPAMEPSAVAEPDEREHEREWTFESQALPPPEPATAVAASFDPRPGIVAFAGFGLVPTSLLAMPSYALRVLARRRVLHAGLAIARKRRPHDVELYRAALDAADGVAVKKGIALLAAITLVGLLVLAAAVVALLA